MPLQTSVFLAASSFHGLGSLSFDFGGIETRFQSLRSALAKRSVQPFGSLSRALLVSLTSPAWPTVNATIGQTRTMERMQQRMGNLAKGGRFKDGQILNAYC